MYRLILAAMALALGVTLIALSVAMGPTNVQAGNGSPTATPDPTIDPCDQFKPPLPATCVPTQPPRSEATNTPTASDTPAATNTSPPPAATNTSAPPPPATATPGGGAGAGGVSPPDTGSGPAGGSGTDLSRLLMAGAALAAAGAASLAYSARRAR